MGAALKFGLPTTTSRSYVEAGALLGYTADLSEQADRVASFIDRILRDAKPSELPVERPTKFHLTINLKTAKALGITLPQSLLLQATDVIQ